MPFLILLLGATVLALIFGPQIWVRRTMARHADERPDFPGTGSELARHLLDEAGLHDVKVEPAGEEGDHYDPQAKVVRLSDLNYHGRSVTAVAVAAHEVGHALQDAQGYKPLQWRQMLVQHALVAQRIGAVLMLASPLVFGFTRSPALLVMELLAAFAIMGMTVAVHAVTLPTELDASFNRAMPVLKKYIREDDLPAARQVLKAAAMTYVAAALVSLLDVMRWLRVLRF